MRFGCFFAKKPEVPLNLANWSFVLGSWILWKVSKYSRKIEEIHFQKILNIIEKFVKNLQKWKKKYSERINTFIKEGNYFHVSLNLLVYSTPITGFFLHPSRLYRSQRWQTFRNVCILETRNPHRIKSWILVIYFRSSMFRVLRISLDERCCTSLWPSALLLGVYP